MAVRIHPKAAEAGRKPNTAVRIHPKAAEAGRTPNAAVRIHSEAAEAGRTPWLLWAAKPEPPAAAGALS